jgi:hypothetical protein
MSTIEARHFFVSLNDAIGVEEDIRCSYEPVHLAYNPSFSACFFSQNSIFLLQQISQQCFSAGLSAQSNGAYMYKV